MLKRKRILASALVFLVGMLFLSGCGAESRDSTDRPRKINDHYVIYDWDDFYAAEKEIEEQQNMEYARLREEYRTEQQELKQQQEAEKLALAKESGENPSFTMLDVGQGLCCFVKSGLQTMLYDTGSQIAEDKLISFLQENGIGHLDYLILSHPDEDHIGNASAVLSTVPTDNVVLRMEDLTGKETATAKQLLHVLENADTTVLEPETGTKLPFGRAQIEIQGPLRTHEEVNDNSLVVTVAYGQTRILLAGDSELEAEEELVEAGIPLKADAYVVSHHGSYNGTSESFLSAVNPRYVLISCGVGNDYGHPHASAMALFANETEYLYRTDLQGDITCIMDAGGLYFEKQPCQDYSCGDDVNGA